MSTRFDEKINRLGTYSTQWDYIQDRFGEEGLLPFSISDMDFQVPSEVMESLHERLAHGVFGYTRWDHDDYKQAIFDWYEKRFDVKIDKNQIVYSPSVCYSIAKMIELLTEKGDHVIIQTPAYDAFFRLIESNERQCIENELVKENGYYTMDFEDLEEKLANPRAKIFLLCSPHNPTGRVWTEQELKKIVGICQKYNVFIISDEIHMDVIRKGKKHSPLMQLVKNNQNFCICTSASKTFNTPGLIASYMFVPNNELRERFLHQLKDKDSLSSASIFGTTALIAGYQNASKWVDELNDYFEGNLNYLKKFLTEQLPEISFELPEATFLAWLDVSKLPLTDDELQTALVKIGKVAIMRGDTYGKVGARHLRLNIGCPREKLKEGLERLKMTIRKSCLDGVEEN